MKFFPHAVTRRHGSEDAQRDVRTPGLDRKSEIGNQKFLSLAPAFTTGCPTIGFAPCFSARMGVCDPIPQRDCGRFSRPSLLLRIWTADSWPPSCFQRYSASDASIVETGEYKVIAVGESTDKAKVIVFGVDLSRICPRGLIGQKICFRFCNPVGGGKFPKNWSKGRFRRPTD